MSKHFQRFIEPHTFRELHMEAAEFQDPNLSDVLTPARVACLRVLECVAVAEGLVGYSYEQSTRLRDPIVALFAFLNKHTVGPVSELMLLGYIGKWLMLGCSPYSERNSPLPSLHAPHAKGLEGRLGKAR